MKTIALLFAFFAVAFAVTHSIGMGRALHPEVVFGEAPEVVAAATKEYLEAKWGHMMRNPVKRAPSPINMGGNINPLGIFYVNISMGKPAQSIAVAVDSGSFTLLVPGPNCKGCPSAPAKFDWKQSTSASQTQCDSTCPSCNDNNICAWSNTYETCNLTDTTQSCTVSGLVYEDYFSLGGLTSQETTRFGIIDFQTKNFQQLYVIDGILGFSLGTTFGQVAQIFQLASEGQISKKFGMCFDSDKQGGLLTLGEPDKKLYTGALKNIPLIANQAYVIGMTDIQVGGTTIGVPASDYSDVEAGGCIVDSGTNILLLPDEMFRATKETFLGMCKQNKLKGICDVKKTKTFFDGECYPVHRKQLEKFPDLTLVYDDVTMVLPPTSYLLPKVGDDSKRCLGIQNTGIDGLLIIGDTTMQQYYTVFDLENNYLSIAPVNKGACKTTN